MLSGPEAASLQHAPVVDSTPQTTGNLWGDTTVSPNVRKAYELPFFLVAGFSAYLHRVTWRSGNTT